MSLTPKQQRFVEEYLCDLNASAAARRAGYSERTAGSMGHELLKKPEIAEAITAARAVLSEKTGITQARVLQELARIGLSDPRRLMRWGAERVEFVPSDDLTDDEAAAVASVKAKTRTVTDDDGRTETSIELELKTHDKLSALDKLGRHLGLFEGNEGDGGPAVQIIVNGGPTGIEKTNGKVTVHVGGD